EDGIRDYKVTGVQTCALPICSIPGPGSYPYNPQRKRGPKAGLPSVRVPVYRGQRSLHGGVAERLKVLRWKRSGRETGPWVRIPRSEERRVGKECRAGVAIDC